MLSYFILNIKTMKKSEILNLIISIALILSIGVLSGYSIGYYETSKKSFPNIKTIQDINEGTTTIKLMEIKNGEMIGEIAGRDGRIAYNSDSILTVKKGETFKIPLNKIHLKNYYISKSIPENIEYISSKSGKYYYSIFNKKAYNLSEKNRILFKTK